MSFMYDVWFNVLWPTNSLFANILISTFALWVLYVPAITLYRKYQLHQLPLLVIPFAAIYSGTFFILDILFNFTYGSIIFFEFPPKGAFTLSRRLADYIAYQPDTWRGKRAKFFCLYLIEPWDPKHCSLSKVV